VTLWVTRKFHATPREGRKGGNPGIGGVQGASGALQGADPDSGGYSRTIDIVARSFVFTGWYDAGFIYCFTGGVQTHDVSAPTHPFPVL